MIVVGPPPRLALRAVITAVNYYAVDRDAFHRMLQLLGPNWPTGRVVQLGGE